jgi:hypothetical protein
MTSALPTAAGYLLLLAVLEGTGNLGLVHAVAGDSTTSMISLTPSMWVSCTLMNPPAG